MGYVFKLCGWYPSRVDNLSGDFVQRHAIAIATQVKTVVLFAQKDPNIRSGKIEKVVAISGNLHEYIFYYPKKRFFDKAWSQWYYLRILRNFLPGLLSEHGKPAFMHVNIVWRAALWALYLHKCYKWPYFITENSTEYQPNALENIRSKSGWRKMITRKAFEKSRLFIPVSKQLGKTINALYGAVDFEVVPNAVDTSIFFYDPVRPPNTIKQLLHISTMGHQKNIDGIFRVIEQLSRSALLFEIVLVGPTTDVIIKQVADSKALSKNVTITGTIAYESVAALMRKADGLFLFSRYENLPCVILEALCCGVPVITTDVGGIPEIITEANGVLVANEDEPALLKALTNFIADTKIFDREKIAADARQRYNYETVGKMFFKIYASQFPCITGIS